MVPFSQGQKTLLNFYNFFISIGLCELFFTGQVRGISIAFSRLLKGLFSMKVAIPVYGDYVSNVFDFAHRLLLVDIENGKETGRRVVEIEGFSLPQRARHLKTHGVDVLVCGAVSQLLANMVTQSGIEILPYVTGNTDNVLGAYVAGQLVRPEFCMPGCWPGARRGFGRRRGCRWQRGRH